MVLNKFLPTIIYLILMYEISRLIKIELIDEKKAKYC